MSSQRRSGLAPSEFQHIQREWLAKVVPEGITVDELSQAVFPSSPTCNFVLTPAACLTSHGIHLCAPSIIV